MALGTTACAGGEPTSADTGFAPVRAGASGFADGAPRPAVAGALSVSRTIDGASFYARVEDPGPSDLPAGETLRFRLAGVQAPDEAADECLARPSTTHLNGAIRGPYDVEFVVAEGGDVDDEAGIPVHVWSRAIWVNGEVVARGYGVATEGAGADRVGHVEAAEDFARDGGEGRWNRSLCDQDAADGREGA